jgi:serine/threonine-protein kinase RsbW
MSGGPSIRVPAATVSDLAAIRAFVRTAASSLDASPHAVPDLVLAVDEAVTNIIRHGYGTLPGPISVELQRDRERIIVRVTDEAPPFDPTRWPAPSMDAPLEHRPAGGFGIHLVRSCVDEVVHHRAGQAGNELILVKSDRQEGGEGTDEHER